MKQYTIRKAELIYMNRAMRRVFSATLKVFREAVMCLGNVVLDNWDLICTAPSLQERKGIVEALIHHTKDNPSPAYKDFDRLFYKFPSYYRRSAIEFTLGQVGSWLSRLAKWEEEKHQAMSDGKKFGKRPPRPNLDTNACPTLYKTNMFKVENGTLKIKVYIRRTWDWVEVGIPARDVKSLAAMEAKSKRVCCPQLTYRYGKFYLVFPFEPVVSGFQNRPLHERIVIGTDLGINNGAVCSAVTMNGHIYGRHFDPFCKERADIDRILGRIRYLQRKTGRNSLACIYTKLEGIKENYTCQLAHWIVDVAVLYNAYGIVLEHLGRMKGRGSRKDRIHHWCKCRVRDLVKGLAFRHGIRVFIINPKNTSALAYDGSGKVKRDDCNFSLCTFSSGKQYNCDLNASYNIASRYYLREMQKAMSFEAWEQLVAKVPETAKRTSCTLSTLWKVQSFLLSEAA